MSPVALTLNLTLGVLLIGAMVLGLRLDRRLRALRDSHNSFAKAVSELDQAALRTQTGLNALKATAEGVRAELAEQLHNARILSERLVKLTEAADAKAEVLAKAQADARALAQSAPARPSLPRRIAEPTPRAASKAFALAEPPRARPAVDDELFESVRSGPAQRGPAALMGGRR